MRQIKSTMTHSLKLAGLASLLLFLGSCSSDDTLQTPVPPIEELIEEPKQPSATQQYFISTMDVTSYTQHHIADKDYSIKNYNDVYTFHYAANNTPTSIDKTTTNYNALQEPTAVWEYYYTFEFNTAQQLTQFSLKSKETSNAIKVFTNHYEEGLLKNYIINLFIQAPDYLTLKYNDQKQFTSFDHSLFSFENKDVFKFFYNQKGQLIKHENLFDNRVDNFTYDNKRTPFYNFPIHFNAVLFYEFYYIPITYIFLNNITKANGSKITSPTNNKSLIFEYTYNEANLPSEVTVYYQYNYTTTIRHMKIKYTYTARDI